MKGDFTRLPPPSGGDPTLTGLWLQQGRPLLDADWNALAALLRDLSTGPLRDILGPAAGPARDLGFAILPAPCLSLNEAADGGRQGLRLGPGRSLPFAQNVPAWTVERVEIDALDRVLILEEVDEVQVPERPWTLLLRLLVPAGGHGPLLERPGVWRLMVGADGALSLLVGDTSHAMGRVEFDRWIDLLLVDRGPWLEIAIDGAAATRTPTHGHHHHHHGKDRHPPERQPVLLIGHSRPVGKGHGATLACRLSALHLWRFAADSAAFARARRAGHLPRHRLVADLDFTLLLPCEGELHLKDRSGHGNDGVVHGSARPPRIRVVDVTVGAGRYFLEGDRLLNPAPVTVGAQPFLPGGSSLPRTGANLYYLEGFQRGRDAAQCPSLLDPALDGIDTVVRSEQVWQVKCLHGADEQRVQDQFQALNQEKPGGLRLWCDTEQRTLGVNGLYRVEIHDPGWAQADPLPAAACAALRMARIVQTANRRVALPAGMVPPAVGAPVWVGAAADGSGGSLARVASIPGDPAGLLVLDRLPDGVGDGDAISILPLATWKFSRENAGLAQTVETLLPGVDADGTPIVLVRRRIVGPSPARPVDGDWAELVEDADELLGRPGRLCPVLAADDGRDQILLGGWVPRPGDGGPAAGRILRIWDVPLQPALDDPDPPEAGGGWPRLACLADQTLDPGVHIAFQADGRYRTGDYWTATLRGGQVAVAGWDPAQAKAPDGPTRHRAPLAEIWLDAQGVRVRDRRYPFLSLAEISALLGDGRDQHFLQGLAAWAEAWRVDPPDPLTGPDEQARNWVRRGLARLLHDDLRLLAAGSKGGDGFWRSGAVVAADTLSAGHWHKIDSTSDDIRGPGHAFMIGPLLGFVEEMTGRVQVAEPGRRPWSVAAIVAPAHGMAVTAGRDLVFIGGGWLINHGLPAHDWVLLDPVTGREVARGRLKIPVAHATASLIDGLVHVVGGYGPGREPQPCVQLVDLANGRCHIVGDMPEPVMEQAAVTLGGMVLLAGGRHADGRVRKGVALMSARSAGWIERAPLPHGLARPAATLARGGVALAGGIDHDGCDRADVLCYRPDSDDWLPLPPLPQAGHGFGLTVTPDAFAGLQPRLFAVGGQRGHDGHHHALHDTLSLAQTQLLHVLANRRPEK